MYTSTSVAPRAELPPRGCSTSSSSLSLHLTDHHRARKLHLLCLSREIAERDVHVMHRLLPEQLALLRLVM